METEEGDTPADVRCVVPAKGDRPEGGHIDPIDEGFFQVNQIDPIHDVNALAITENTTPSGEEKSGGNSTTHTGGIKIGINKRDYDLYISQLKDKGVKDVETNNAGQMRSSIGEGKSNEYDSDYCDIKNLDGSTTECFDDGDACNKRTMNTIISRMDSDLTNTEDALSKVNDNSTTYMSNENNICLVNNEADVTDHTNFNPSFEFDEMVGPTDKTTYVENCDGVHFFKNGEARQIQCTAGEDGSDDRSGNFAEHIVNPEMNNTMPLTIAQPFGETEQKSKEDKIPNPVNPNFCDQPHLSKLQEVVHNNYAFVDNKELSTQLGTFCSRIQNDEGATSVGGGPLYQLNGEGEIEATGNLHDETAFLASTHLYEGKDAHQSDLSVRPTTAHGEHHVNAATHFYIQGGIDQGEDNGKISELPNHFGEKITSKGKENGEEELRTDSEDKKFLFQQREQSNVHVSSHYHHLYEDIHRDTTEESRLRMTSNGISDGNGSGNVVCSSGEIHAENHGAQQPTPPQDGGNTHDVYNETFAMPKKVGRRAGRKSKSCVNRSGESNGDTKGGARISLKSSGACDVNATADCTTDCTAECATDRATDRAAAGEHQMNDPTLGQSKHNEQEEQPNGDDPGRAKNEHTNETYPRRPLRNAAKKCIHLWSEELKKKSEKHNAALERNKNMSDQRKEERAMRRKEKVIKNGSKVILRGGLGKGYGGRGWARGEAKRDAKFYQDGANGIDHVGEEQGAQYEQQEGEVQAGEVHGVEEGAEGVNGKMYCEEGQEVVHHRRARGRPPQRTGSHTDPKVRERNQANEAYMSGQIKPEQLNPDTNERGTKGGRKKNDLSSSLGQEHDSNIPILFNDSMDEREMFKYLDLLRHLPSKKGGAQYKLHKAILTEEMVRRAKKFPLVQGVYFDRYQQRWSVNWNEDGKRVAKYFPIKLFGFDYARRLAIYCKNFQKIPEEALIFEQAYRASQQSSKQRSDHAEGANVAVSEMGSGNGSGKLRRGGPRKGYKKRGLRKQDNLNEDKTSSGCGKRRKNINNYQGGEMGSTMSEGQGDNQVANQGMHHGGDEGGNRAPGKVSSSNYPLCSNYSGSANSGVGSGLSSGVSSGEKKDPSYRSDGGAKDMEYSGPPKGTPYFPGGSLPSSQGVGGEYTGSMNPQHNLQHVQHMQHIWGGLGNVNAPAARNAGGRDKQYVQGYLFEGDFQNGDMAKQHDHPHSGLPSGAPFGCTPNQPNEGSNSVNPSTDHVKEEQKNLARVDASADRSDLENMMLMRQKMIMLEQGTPANANKYMPFANATMGFPIAHSSNEMRRFGSGETPLDGDKRIISMHNVVGSGVNNANENDKQLSSNALPQTMMGNNSTVENEKKKKKRGRRKKGESKKNHFVYTSTGTSSSFKSSSSHMSSTSSCYKNIEMHLSSNGPLHDIGEAHSRWRKGERENTTDAAAADAAHNSSYNDDRGNNYYTTNEDGRQGDAATIQVVEEDKVSRANLMEGRGDANNDSCYLHVGTGPSRVEQVPEEGKEEQEDDNDNDYDHMDDNDVDDEAGGDDAGRNVSPQGAARSTVDGGRNEEQVENDGNKMEDILNINKYSEIVNGLDNYNLMSRMNQMGVKVERELIPFGGGLNLKRENTQGASKDRLKEEVHQGEEVTVGEIPNGGDITQENNPDDINSRIVGVHYDRKQYRWKATWYTSHGRRCAKYYPIKQYGYLEAKKMAIECRRAYNAYKKLKKDPENGIEEAEFNFDSTIFPKEYYITLFENDEKKDGYFWNPKKNKKTGKRNPLLDNNEKQRRHYNEALKKITNIKYKDLSQLNEFMARRNDGEVSTYASMAMGVDVVEGSNLFAPPAHPHRLHVQLEQEEQGEGGEDDEVVDEEDYSGAHLDTTGMGAYQGGAFQAASHTHLATTNPSADTTATMSMRNIDNGTPPIQENEQSEEWTTLQGVYNKEAIFQPGCCNVMSEEENHVTSKGCSAHVSSNSCSTQNVSSLLSLYYLSENILKFQKGTIKCILQDLRDNCLSNLAYDIQNITFQEYYMAIHYLNRYVEDSNCYDDIFFLLKILAKNLEIRKIPSLYNEEEQKELLNSLTVITKQMKSGYSYFTPDPVRSSSDGGDTASGMSPSDRFSVIFQ
ncbi:hypothetical protein AK88_03209 [Plasmodium fragile]|uniref:AP2/ERF domain-containing protein n=1 Tax=Plasmodium fragile TaxID=5857 RepID=A0A0D9QK50_PLAFR|nr:uncharacterized protein AK88_03209 [Plasmodium fragile]KJP87162.1 hypothetical protein AK88_03209 [Plasmodium fragile]